MTSISRIVRMEPDHESDERVLVRWSDGTVAAYHKPYIDALREYFARPKVPTPRERANRIMQEINPGHPQDCGCDLETAIAAAIEDAARRGVDWESDET